MTVELKFRATMRKYGLLSQGDRVLVGVSGGPDSVALLHLLFGCSAELNLHLEVAHLMHGIRGEEATQDAKFVEDLANKLGLAFHLKDVNVAKEKERRGKGNIEAIGREERYRFFAAVARTAGCSKIATGHTCDDRVETLLMWLFRGAGRGALAGIPPVRSLGGESHGDSLEVIRPLIEISKQEVITYLEKCKLAFRHDRTNLDPMYLRNWIRLRLLPELRRRTDAHLDRRLAQLCDLMWEEDQWLNGVSLSRLQHVVHKNNLDLRALLKEKTGLQRRLLRLWLQQNGLRSADLNFNHVEKCLRFLAEGPAQGRLCLPRGWDIVKEYDAVRLEKRSLKSSRSVYYYQYDLALTDDLMIPEAGVRIRSSVHPSLPVLPARELWKAVFDLERVAPALTVRNFRYGDRFQPLGMKGRKKVKDLFIERKVPAGRRRTWPFLLCGDEILWIPGYGRSDVAKIGPNTTRVLKVEAQLQSESDAVLK